MGGGGGTAACHLQPIEKAQKRAIRNIARLKKYDHTGLWFKKLGILRFSELYKTTVFAYGLRNRQKLGIRVREGKSARVGGLLTVDQKRWLKTRSRQQIGYMLPKIVTEVSGTALREAESRVTAIHMKRLWRTYLEEGEGQN